ncbi:MAG: tandem-95 repeat protein [Methyloprofundus sp.]|nr:tandem-95 repeat protein [Methyloprofundus sp.]
MNINARRTMNSDSLMTGLRTVLLLGLILNVSLANAVGRAFISPATIEPNADRVLRFSVNVEGVDAPGLRAYAYELDFQNTGLMRLVDTALVKNPTFGLDNISAFRDKISCSTQLRVTAPELMIQELADESGIPAMSLESGQGSMMLNSQGSEPISCVSNGLMDADTGQYVCGAAGEITEQTGNGVIAEYVCYVGPDVPVDSTISVTLRRFVNAAENELSGVISLNQTNSHFMITDLTSANIVVTQAVNIAPVADDDSALVNEDESVNINILDGDTDTEDSVPSGAVTIVDMAGNGVATLNIDRSITYTPHNNFFGTDIFTYRIQDSAGAESNIATVTVSVVEINDAPVANVDTATTNEDTLVTIAVLDNDADIDSPTLELVSVTQADNGSVLIVGNALTYTPASNFFGSDSFTYTLSDTEGGSANATVSVAVNSVNDSPVANNDSTSTDTNVSIDINVLNNDSDVEDTKPTGVVSTVSLPNDGVISVVGASVKYTPDINFNGNDSFSYQVKDSDNADSNIATVTINVGSGNDVPVAVDDTAVTDEDVSVIIDVIANDTDIEDLGGIPAGAIRIASQPTNGSVEIDNGAVIYTPNINFNGEDIFTYTVKDAEGEDSNTATVRLVITAVNDLPSAVINALLNVETGVQVSIDGSASNDLDNDTIDFSWVLNTPAGSTASLNSTSVSKPLFTPDIEGIYELTLTLTDSQGAEAIASVEITATNAVIDNVGPNAIVIPSALDVFVGEAVSFDGSTSSDPDSFPNLELSYVWEIIAQPVASAAGLSDANTPIAGLVPDVAGEYQLQLSVSDGEIVSMAQVLITATEANVPPVANAGEDQALELGQTVQLDGYQSHDIDDSFDSLSFSWSLASVPITSSLNDSSLTAAASDSASFMPDVAGEYLLKLDVTDPQEATSSDQVSITISEVIVAEPADLDGDGDVDMADLNRMKLDFGLTGLEPGHPSDLNGDGAVNVLDFRMAVRLCTRARCAE